LGRCEDLVNKLRSENVISDYVKKDKDFYDLAENIVRGFEQILREDPSREDHEKLVREVMVRLYRFYAEKRIKELPEEKKVSEIAGKIVKELLSMDPIQREICYLYFSLKSQGKREIDELMKI